MTMRWPRWLNLLCLWLALISAIIIIVTVVSIPLFRFWMQLDNLPRIAGMGAHRLMHNYLVMWSYLYAPWEHRLWLPDFRVSVNGAIHFRDVQHLFLLNLTILVVTLWPAWRWLRNLRRNHRMYVLRNGGWVGLLTVFVLLASMALNFNGFFIKFHELFFRNNDWEFDPALDPIINVLPEGFFAACFVIGFGLLILAMVGMVVWGRRDARR